MDKFPTCNHTHNCDCSGGVTSYVGPYYKLLEIVQPEIVMEWGPGTNTRMALELESVKRVISVEQDKKWIPNLDMKRQYAVHVRVDSMYYTGEKVDFFGGKDADIFFVDSRRRAECIEAVHRHCKLEAVLCLHDAQRSRYHEALDLFPFVHFPIDGFAIASKSAEMAEEILQI
jgi:hypothetical protein